MSQKSTVRSIFQISISRNTKYVEMVDFSIDGHICYKAATYIRTYVVVHVYAI